LSGDEASDHAGTLIKALGLAEGYSPWDNRDGNFDATFPGGCARGVHELTNDDLIGALRLPAGTNPALPFKHLGIDSWDLVEFRALLEIKFGLTFSDDDWVSLSCPADIMRNGHRRYPSSQKC
jgi:acyl carrier protein